MSKQLSVFPGVVIGTIAGIAATLLVEQFRKPSPAAQQASEGQSKLTPSQVPARSIENSARPKKVQAARSVQSKKAKSPAASSKTTRRKSQTKPSDTPSSASLKVSPAASPTQLRRVV